MSQIPQNPSGNPAKKNVPPATPLSRERWPRDAQYIACLLLLTLVMFGDVLFSLGPAVLSNRATDIALEYGYWRAFGFAELKRGSLALWNPHLFCGAPFFAGAQAALLYPLNLPFLFLPLHAAINWCIALQVFLAGAFTFAWTRLRGLSAPAAFLAGVIYMFCGANFLHIYSGYLSFLCAFSWTPLVFLAIDGIFKRPALHWGLLGAFAVAMLVLAGNPQCLFYTAVAAGLYAAMNIVRAVHRLRVALALAGMAAGGVALSAAQVFAGLDEWRELLRSSGVPFSFAASFSFPPENFATLLAPHLLGDIKTVSYWGRCYLWEMSLYIGVPGLVLAVAGAIWGDARQRRFSVTMVCLLVLLALGAHTPLFRVLYDWVPGFNKFRGNSKFIFLASLFLGALAGIGWDELGRRGRIPAVFALLVGLLGLCLLGGAVAVYPGSAPAGQPASWAGVMAFVGRLGESYVPPSAYNNIAFTFGAARLAALSLLIGGLLLCVVALALRFANHSRLILPALLALAVMDLFVFGRRSLDRFDPRDARSDFIQNFLREHPGDFRIAGVENPNAALVLGAQDVWGYEPGIVSRYAQLVAVSRGLAPEQAEMLTTMPGEFGSNPSLLRLLRCRYVFTPRDEGMEILENTNYLPHVLLVSRCRISTNRQEILTRLLSHEFDPASEVILETPPDPPPSPSPNPGSVILKEFSTDALVIEADVATPAVLLVPDVYAKGWRVRALPGSSQQQYHLQPGDWCLRAVPLAAGHHALRMEYRPIGFAIGRWISAVSLPIFFVLLAVAGRGFAVDRARITALAQAPVVRPESATEPGFVPRGVDPVFCLPVAIIAALAILAWPLLGRNIMEYGNSFVPFGVLLAVLAGCAFGISKATQLAAKRRIIWTLVCVVLGIGMAEYISTSGHGAGSRDRELAKNPTPGVSEIRKAAAELARSGKLEEAIARLEAGLRALPNEGEIHGDLAALRLQTGRLTAAMTEYEAALATRTEDPEYLNNLAWLLATSPIPNLRDGPRALRLAATANRLTGNTNVFVLETLAASYAATAQYREAAAVVSRAMTLTDSNGPRFKTFEEQLRSYQTNSAWTDATLTNAPSPLR